MTDMTFKPYEAVIGLEVHVELKPGPRFSAIVLPNSGSLILMFALCLGLPGVLSV